MMTLAQWFEEKGIEKGFSREDRRKGKNSPCVF